MPDEDWIMEVLPELNSLEGDTLDMLLVQAETHVRYEKAARQLIHGAAAGDDVYESEDMEWPTENLGNCAIPEDER